MTEEWRPIPKYAGLYEASSLGRVRSVTRKNIDQIGRTRSYSSIVLKDRSHAYGYRRVDLYMGGRRRTEFVHQLVADAFYPDHNGHRLVNHKNGKKSDNRADNLEWTSYSENTRHYLMNRNKDNF